MIPITILVFFSFSKEYLFINNDEIPLITIKIPIPTKINLSKSFGSAKHNKIPTIIPSIETIIL
jgi:hypothetical protein